MNQRITRTTQRFLTACTAFGILAAPVAAHAVTPGGLAADLGVSVLKSVVSYGVDGAMEQYFGDGTVDMVSLMDDAIDQIDTIVNEAVDRGQFNDYQINARSAEVGVSDYYFEPEDLEASLERAEDAIVDLRNSWVQMEAFELQGLPTYMILAALDVQMHREALHVATAQGHAATISNYADAIEARATRHLNHVDAMRQLWLDGVFDIYPIFKRTAASGRSGEQQWRKQQWCFDSVQEDAAGGLESARFCSARWLCTRQISYLGVPVTSWSCENNDAERSEMETLRWEKVRESRDRIFGEPEAFERLRSGLMVAAGQATEVNLRTDGGAYVRAVGGAHVYSWGPELNDEAQLLRIERADGTVIFRTPGGYYLTSDLDRRCHAGVWYTCYTSNGQLTATSTDKEDPAIRFTEIVAPDGRLHLRNADGRNMRAMNGGNGDVRCDATYTGDWTRFVIEDAPAPQ